MVPKDAELWEKTHALYEKMRPLLCAADKEIASDINSAMLSLLASISQAGVSKSCTEQKIFYTHALRLCARIDSCLTIIERKGDKIPRSSLHEIHDEIDIMTENLEPLPVPFRV